MKKPLDLEEKGMVEVADCPGEEEAGHLEVT